MIGILELAIIILVAVPLGLILPIFALINLIRNKLNVNKLLWGVIIVCIPVFGPLLYFIKGRKQ